MDIIKIIKTRKMIIYKIMKNNVLFYLLLKYSKYSEV